MLWPMVFDSWSARFTCVRKKKDLKISTIIHSYQSCAISVVMKVRVSLTFDGQLDDVNPRPLQRLLVHPAAHLPVVVRRCGNRPVLAAQRHRAIRVGFGVGGDGECALGDPLDGCDRFPVGGIARGHDHRPGASLDRHRFGRVLGLGWRRETNEKRDKLSKRWEVKVKRKWGWKGRKGVLGKD